MHWRTPPLRDGSDLESSATGAQAQAPAYFQGVLRTKVASGDTTFGLVLQLQAIEQNVLSVGVGFVCERFNLQPPTLSDRASSGGFEVLAKMLRRNVRKRAKFHLQGHDSPRTLITGNRFNLPHQIVYEREFVHNSSFTLQKTSSAATLTS